MRQAVENCSRRFISWGRVEKITAIITKKMEPGWYEYDIPRIGRVSVNCMTAEAAAKYGSNQCWLRLGYNGKYERESSVSWDHELRGSAEAVAAKLCQFLRSPSKAAAEAAEAIKASFEVTGLITFNGMRAEEIAAWLGLDETATFKALDYLAEQGLVRNEGDRGWFRVEAKLMRPRRRY